MHSVIGNRTSGNRRGGRARRASAFLAIALIFIGGCRRGSVSVYEPTPGALYEGSLYYSAAGCQNCHGVRHDGKSDEVDYLKTKNLTMIDFSAMRNPKKVPLDYYKAITVSTEAMRKAGEEHAFQGQTDRARWAMANFLYSLAPKLESEERQQALRRARIEVEEAYRQAEARGRRRWELGYVPVDKRDKAPKLDDLIRAAGPAARVEADNAAKEQ